jgi:hypothetical protein
MSTTFAKLSCQAAELRQEISLLIESNTHLLTPLEFCELWRLYWLCDNIKKKALARSCAASLPSYRDLTPQLKLQ